MVALVADIGMAWRGLLRGSRIDSAGTYRQREFCRSSGDGPEVGASRLRDHGCAVALRANRAAS
jgi:hypothetical protein